MDRLHDLRRTLPANLADNAEYRNLEFVLLDYNSRDGLADWVRSHLAAELKSGRVVYFRTSEPEHYRMAHSRNVACALAQGDIVASVDADNFTNAGFADHLNRLANELPEKTVFIKSWQRMHGRVAFRKSEWLGLGGYDESFVGYGYDDMDLVLRAVASGFTLARFGGQFARRLSTPSAAKVTCFERKDWRATQEENRLRSEANLARGQLHANREARWAVAHVVRNFSHVIQVGLEPS
jgi:glycosyltransferase involved in cell wall biosynthesis